MAPPPAFASQSTGRSPARMARPRVEWSPCLRLVNLLIRKPDIIEQVQIPDELGEIRSPDMDLLLKVIEIARAWPTSTTPELMYRIYATPYGNQLTQLLGKELITPEAGILDEFRDVLQRLVNDYLSRKSRNETLETLRKHHQETI
jgi:hypothetical protein